MKVINCLILTVLLFSCAPQRKDDILVNFNEKITLAVNQPKAVGGAGNEVSIKVNNIQDSRCPKDVVCVWEGYVDVEFLLFNSQNQQTAFTLCLGRCDAINKSSALNVALGSENYKITLFEVSEGENAKVVFAIEKI
jgi:hypothetical protein